MNLISWNVNGINACARKGLLGFIKKEDADVYCFQELKSYEGNVDKSLLNIGGYNAFWLFAEKKGYSGVAACSRIKPLSVTKGIGDKEIDKEGRVLTLEFKNFFLINAYFPHSGRSLERLGFKLHFNRLFLEFCQRLRKKKPILIASDFNVAHKEIDLANPRQNEKNAGFTIEEREWFTEFLKQGYIDSFREFTKEPGHYTWWTYRFNARARNIGWRVDYFVISSELKKQLLSSEILDKVIGSDHCPIRLMVK
ncbi:MAG: exodeoxyribonuclease III [Candidatus Omnitrophica bacterium CG1_02_40_15]|nr:MAG: exodeoxyribonuclease III [Candidatus Omnitrophica bacterium CG1_02_40_15]